MENIKISKQLIFILGIFLLIACSNQQGSKDFTPENITIRRFEADLFAIPVYEIEDNVAVLEQKYPDFFPLFTSRIIEIGTSKQHGFSDRLIAFTTDFTIFRVSERVKEVFPDLSSYEQELSYGFGRFKYYFPDRQIPQLISCISGFNQSIITGDSLLVISIDKYLGVDEEFYELLFPPVPEYQRYNMHPGKIVSDALYAWIVTEYPFHAKKDDLLSNMVFLGRAKYCVKQLLPEVPDSLLWGFTDQQMQFCYSNELPMWEHLVEQQLLFETESFSVNQLVGEAPFTKIFSRESPGKAAVWVGYKIVEAYMKNNQEVELQQLMEEKDYLKISNYSKYNP